jgi:hypothetical protein
MEYAVAAVLIVLSAAFVALPFLRAEELQAPTAARPGGIAMSDAARQKADAYAAIKEADFDFQMGKLSEADHTALRDKYAAQALAAIAVLEGSHAPAKTSFGHRPRRVAYCPQCGTEAAKRGNFCGGCGMNLKQLAA